ncbi:MAG: KamA family radical SAM protein [Candidatus Eisenbacteria bacterium]|nr:KamA family radical SAM protein [Candidatus Eisenbacteria bacterium]
MRDDEKGSSMDLDLIGGTAADRRAAVQEGYDAEALRAHVPELCRRLRERKDPSRARKVVDGWAHEVLFSALDRPSSVGPAAAIRIRDCAEALRGMATRRAEKLAGFSLARALYDVAHGVARPDLTPAFFADVMHTLAGLEGQALGGRSLDAMPDEEEQHGRAAGIRRSGELDELWTWAQGHLQRYPSGLDEEVIQRRASQRERVLQVLGGDGEDWHDWRWQTRHVIRDARTLGRIIRLTESEAHGIRLARENHVPFGVTPYYAALMDPEPSGRDQAVRYQVIPPPRYVEGVCAYRQSDPEALDFMREHDTSPIDLITRRYPAICILKPVSTCPQICVYCQRNWEIQEVMASKAIARPEQVAAALDWIEAHPAIEEVLITGGDPLILANQRLAEILARLAGMASIKRVRIGSRTPVTLPMRITEKLVAMLMRYHQPPRREVALVTHFQHPYEITPEVVSAIGKLRRRQISVYNQQVFTFFVSRRFESAALRLALRRADIDPYYVFNMKGKREMLDYRVPIARLLQEQREEARLLPGIVRTDAPVYNIPGKGKNHLRARQHRHLLTIRPSGARVYEFHPWEKHLSRKIQTYVGEDVPILEYLERLAERGEDPDEYATIWYYF